MKINDYNEKSLFCATKEAHVKLIVRANFPVCLDSRSINGGQVGNRHALKHGFRMWDHSGNVIVRGYTPIEKEEYSPNF